MLLSKETPIPRATAYVSLLVFGVMAMLLHTPYVYDFDRRIIHRIQSLESDLLTSIMHGFSWIGSTWVVILLVIITMLALKYILNHRVELLVLAITMIGTGLLNVLLKVLIGRERPTMYRLAEAGGFSFPSGHTMGAVAFYGILTYLLWRHMPTSASKLLLIAASSAMIFGIAISRIYLGVHYPTDIIGGVAAGLGWMMVVISYFQTKVFYRRTAA